MTSLEADTKKIEEAAASRRPAQESPLPDEGLGILIVQWLGIVFIALLLVFGFDAYITEGRMARSAATLVVNHVGSGEEGLGLESSFIGPTLLLGPNLSAVQAQSLVASCVEEARPYVFRDSVGYFESQFTPMGQWVVTIWDSEEATARNVGHAYIVEDATGKVADCPSLVKTIDVP